VSAPTRLYHVALAGEWAAAVAGAAPYRTSTLGRSLDEEGYTHCSAASQVAGVLARFYRSVAEPLVLLEIDPARLTSPVRDEVPPGATEAFPHVYGPIDPDAVVAVHPLPVDDAGGHAVPAAVSRGSGGTGPST
jgi:uncharacterized protein (DUF952 family)